MEKLFGDYSVRCKVLQPPEAPAAAEESKEEAAAAEVDVPAEGDNQDLPIEEAFYPYEKVSVEDAMVRTSTTHVLCLFTAEYCPPCQGFM